MIVCGFADSPLSLPASKVGSSHSTAQIIECYALSITVIASNATPASNTHFAIALSPSIKNFNTTLPRLNGTALSDLCELVELVRCSGVVGVTTFCEGRPNPVAELSDRQTASSWTPLCHLAYRIQVARERVPAAFFVPRARLRPCRPEGAFP